MTLVTVKEAKTRFPDLLEKVLQGGEVTISRGGRPVARLVPYRPEAPVRRPGLLKGKIRIYPDFDAPLPAGTTAAFEGEGS